MNPALIKRDVDDEVYSNACPTIGALMIAHFSTPERHREDIYGADGLFFTTYPSRRTYLRPAFPGEYDIDENETENVERPMLWVLVSQLAPGFHNIIPVWRGKAFWNGPEVDSDEGVGRTYLLMCLRGGIHLSEWMSYVFDCRARKSDQSKKCRKETTVH